MVAGPQSQNGGINIEMLNGARPRGVLPHHQRADHGAAAGHHLALGNSMPAESAPAAQPNPFGPVPGGGLALTDDT
eukprot:4812379-Pyramimonas_sp.AAC.1